MILVTGATGNIGRHLVPALLEAQQKIRILVRNPDKVEAWKGRVEVVVGNLDEAHSLVPASKEVTAVFLLAGGGDGVVQTRNILDVLKASGQKPHVVLLSSLGAEDTSLALAKIHADREALVVGSQLPYSILRPGMFMTNTFAWARTIRSTRTVFNPYGEGSMSPIDPSDIAAVAAAVLSRPGYEGRTLELTGPQTLTAPEQVRLLEKALDRKLVCQEISVDESVQGMVKAGFPEYAARMLGDLTARIRGTAKAVITTTVQDVTGRPATSFEAWARKNAAVWS